ncbi:MAG: hypothetical protein JXR48_14965 [Candidatus Delongbacteria bacterium]|nr:hypothetical protein [Candidatus Delongbacteria bacterium]MBN2836258.1 hypothetical protein [Candidatus Delongbacteria bacterium]
MLSLRKMGILLSITSVLLLTSCTRYANEEELKALEEAKIASKKADSKLQELKNERMKLEDELAAKKKELEETKAEKEKVEKAVNQ